MLSRVLRAIVLDDALSDEQIDILPDGGRSRYTASLHVARVRDLKRMETSRSFHAGTFQRQPAKIYRGPSGKYETLEILFERKGDWYWIALILPPGTLPPDAMPSSEWLSYLESFQPTRVDTQRASH